jgi:hypothetical protein
MNTTLEEFHLTTPEGAIIETEVWEVQRAVPLAAAALHLGLKPAKVLQLRKEGLLEEVQSDHRRYVTAQSLEAHSGRAPAVTYAVKIRRRSLERRRPCGLVMRQVWEGGQPLIPVGTVANVIVYSSPDGEIGRITTATPGVGVREITYTFRDPYTNRELRQQSAVLLPDCDEAEVEREVLRCCELCERDWAGLSIRRRRAGARP